MYIPSMNVSCPESKDDFELDRLGMVALTEPVAVECALTRSLLKRALKERLTERSHLKHVEFTRNLFRAIV